MNKNNLINIMQGFLVAFSMLLTTLVSPTLVAHAQDACAGDPNQSKCNSCQAVEVAGGSCDETSAKEKTNSIATTIINVAAIMAGSICVLLVIIGGFRYVISGGDSNSVQGAKNMILYALVGLVIVVFSRVIVNFVLGVYIK